METYEIVLITLASIVGFLLVVYALCGYLFFNGIFKRKPFSLLGEKPGESPQRQMITEGRRKAIEHLDTLSYEQMEVNSFDGLLLKGKMFKTPTPDGRRRLIICVHGYTSHGRREFAAYVPHFHDLGMDVLLVDDRGHGDSEGTHTSFSCLDRVDVKDWIDKVKDNYDKIYLFGISMGAATVAMVAADVPDIAGVLFDCGFTSPLETFKATVKHITPFMPAFVTNPVFFFGRMWCKLTLGFDFKKTSALKEVKKAQCPFLFIQGTADTVVFPYMSDKMFEACGSENKRQEKFEGGEHVASYYIETERYVALLKEFFK